MKFECNVEPLGKTEKPFDKFHYYFKFKTYNATIEGKFEKSELRHLIQIIDNAID